MTLSIMARESIVAYLSRNGWSRQSRGLMGSLWAPTQDPRNEIALPDGKFAVDSREWRSVVERISRVEHRQYEEVVSSIRYQYVDVTNLRAANDLVIAGSIPLTAGASLVESAKDMIRSSATTARRQRAQIAGNFSVVGDELASGARIGHTLEGSYIIPILMPLSMDEPDSETSPPIAGLERSRVQAEAPERRVMRTFAEALTAVQKIVVQPGREPRPRDIPDLVAAGVSREFVVALERVIKEPAVAVFEANFSWAAATRQPTSTPASIEVPSESLDLVKRTARLLQSSRRERPQSITGPIIEMRYVPGDPFGEVAIQAIRNGRPSEIHVRLRPDQIDEAHDWMRDTTTVIVDGEVERTRGRPALIQKPTRFATLQSTFLDGDSRKST